MSSTASNLNLSTNISSPSFLLPNFPQGIHAKLDGSNYLNWLSRFLPALRSNGLMGIVDGSDPCPPEFLVDAEGKKTLNPEFTLWTKKDQYLLSWINFTLSEDVLSTVYGLDTSKQVWTALANRFASQSRSRIAHLKRQFQNLTQGSKTCSEHLQTAKSLADQLAAVGKPLPEDDLISYALNGLNPSFNNFITSFSLATRDNPLSFVDFRDELLNHDMLLNQQNAAVSDATNFALFTNRPRSNQIPPNNKMQYTPKFQPRNFTPKHAHGTSDSRPKSSQVNSGAPFNNGARVPCQICGKTNHQALDCYHRMDYSYQGRHPPTQLAAMVAHTNAVFEDKKWFVDSGANAHITNELENLTIQQPFQGTDTVEVGNGAGLAIENSGPSNTFNSLGREK